MLTLAGCEGRYATTQTDRLAARLEQSFVGQGALTDMAAALTGAGYGKRAPLRSVPDAPPECWSRKVTGWFQLAGSRVIYVCAEADTAGIVTRVLVGDYRNNI